MYTRRRLVLSWLLPISAAGLLFAQDSAQGDAQKVQVTGTVKQPLSLSAEDLAKMPRATVRTTSNGMETVYEGVWLHTVLKAAGVPQGSELRGRALTTYVLAEAQDGYQVVFSLGELDPAFIDNEILLADTANGKRFVRRAGPVPPGCPERQAGRALRAHADEARSGATAKIVLSAQAATRVAVVSGMP